jgi:uncharacterized protein (DUF427 family)
VTVESWGQAIRETAHILPDELIKNHLAFYPDRVDAIEEPPAT